MGLYDEVVSGMVGCMLGVLGLRTKKINRAINAPLIIISDIVPQGMHFNKYSRSPRPFSFPSPLSPSPSPSNLRPIRSTTRYLNLNLNLNPRKTFPIIIIIIRTMAMTGGIGLVDQRWGGRGDRLDLDLGALKFGCFKEGGIGIGIGIWGGGIGF